MTRISPIELVSHRSGAPRAYRVAGTVMVTDVDLPVLRTYVTEGPVTWSADRDVPEATGGETVFDGLGLIVDGQHRVVCRVSAAGYRLAMDGIGAYRIAPDGGRIAEVSADPRCDPEMRAMAALGAPLILALALRGIFCLHASVAAFDKKLMAFIGESGQGKSTLAGYLNCEGGPEWRRVIDDTLPIAPPTDDGATALPHFPQLKLPDEMQPSRLVPERMPLRAVYVLENGAEAAIAPLRRSQAALALAAQTVGGRLFGPELLATHLTFCAELVGRVPVRRLMYPRSFDALPAVRDALAADLG